MESEVYDIGIKREEIEIFDVKIEEEEEEVEDDKPFFGFDDSEFDVKVPNFYKELYILEKEADSFIGFKTEFVKTDEGDSANQSNLENIYYNISIIGVEFSNTAQENSVTCLENYKMPEHYKRTAHNKLHPLLNDIQDSSSRGSKPDVLRQRTIRDKGNMANKVLKRKSVSKNIGYNKDSCKKSKQSLIQKDSNCSNNLKKDNLVASESPYPPHMARHDGNKSKVESLIAEKPYSCSYCDYQTCFKNLLDKHRRRHNQKQPWACSKCSYSSASKFCLTRHVETIHEPPQNISCLDCDFKCSRNRRLKNHMVVHNCQNYFKCSECDFKHAKQAIVRRHIVTHLENKIPLLCAICGYRGVKPEYITKHMEKHHRFELDCENSFSFKENIAIKNDYRKIIQKQPVVLLRRCDDAIDGAGNSAANMMKIHEQVLQDNFFDVAKCDESEIIDPESLNSLHQKDDASVVMKSTLVTKNQNIITSIVKVVDDDQSIQAQLNMWKSGGGIKERIISQMKSKQGASISHTESNPIAINEVIYNRTNRSSKTAGIYRCEECSFVSTWLDRYEIHVKLHSGKHFTCNKCDFITKSQASLTRHKRLKHCHAKNFKCEKCDYICSSSQYLKGHMRSHDKAKRFKCEKCNISCKTAATLKRHMSTHDGGKPFACDLCDFRTRFKISLRNHRFVHTGETKHVCKVCNYKFYANASLKKHMELHGPSK